eukprot:gene10383-13947_t
MFLFRWLFRDDKTQQRYMFNQIDPIHSQRYLSGSSSSSESSSSQDDSNQSVFGSLSHIDTAVGTIAIAIIIFAVFLYEQLFLLLHQITNDTAVHVMITRIEKELMIVGCISFIFKVVLSTTELDYQWHHALEFADTLIPIFSVFYCIIGIVLVLMSIHLRKTRSKANHLQLVELIHEYIQESRSIWFWITWNPVAGVVRQLEFRIFHSVFCKLYRIKRTALPFNEYAQAVYERFVRGIIFIRPIDWFLFGLVMGLNLMRTELGLDYYKCNNDDFECANIRSLRLFIASGILLYLITLIFAIISRRMELQILSTMCELNSFEEYGEYLKLSEQIEPNSDKPYFDGTELKEALLEANIFKRLVNGTMGHTTQHLIINKIPRIIRNISIKIRLLLYQLPFFSHSTKSKSVFVESHHIVELTRKRHVDSIKKHSDENDITAKPVMRKTSFFMTLANRTPSQTKAILPMNDEHDADHTAHVKAELNSDDDTPKRPIYNSFINPTINTKTNQNNSHNNSSKYKNDPNDAVEYIIEDTSTINYDEALKQTIDLYSQSISSKSKLGKPDKVIRLSNDSDLQSLDQKDEIHSDDGSKGMKISNYPHSHPHHIGNITRASSSPFNSQSSNIDSSHKSIKPVNKSFSSAGSSGDENHIQNNVNNNYTPVHGSGGMSATRLPPIHLQPLPVWHGKSPLRLVDKQSLANSIKTSIMLSNSKGLGLLSKDEFSEMLNAAGVAPSPLFSDFGNNLSNPSSRFSSLKKTSEKSDISNQVTSSSIMMLTSREHSSDRVSYDYNLYANNNSNNNNVNNTIIMETVLENNKNSSINTNRSSGRGSIKESVKDSIKDSSKSSSKISSKSSSKENDSINNDQLLDQWMNYHNHQNHQLQGMALKELDEDSIKDSFDRYDDLDKENANGPKLEDNIPHYNNSNTINDNNDNNNNEIYNEEDGTVHNSSSFTSSFKFVRSYSTNETHLIRNEFDYRKLFFLSNPSFYFVSVRVLVMLISVYMALWLTNFIFITESVLYQFLILIPGLFSAINYFYVVNSAALLRAVLILDVKVALDILEE